MAWPMLEAFIDCESCDHAAGEGREPACLKRVVGETQRGHRPDRACQEGRGAEGAADFLHDDSRLDMAKTAAAMCR